MRKLEKENQLKKGESIMSDFKNHHQSEFKTCTIQIKRDYGNNIYSIKIQHNDNGYGVTRVFADSRLADHYINSAFSLCERYECDDISFADLLEQF